jgi:hypothetical protein
MQFKVGDRVFDIHNPNKLGTILEIGLYSEIYKQYYLKVKLDNFYIPRLIFIENLRLIKPKLYHYGI